MITSTANHRLKVIRQLHERKHRERAGLFIAEGEDLIAAADAAGWSPELMLVAGEDIEPELLDSVSTLGSGTRVIGVYPTRWEAPREARLSVYLNGVRDPGNVGTVIRAAHALADGSVIFGPECADPYSPKAVRASMGSIFARTPSRPLGPLPGKALALDQGADAKLSEVEVAPPIVICVGGERQGLPRELLDGADLQARIAMNANGPDSLNAAMAATVALYELGTRIDRHA
jgi:RNA methyltransferase, TrmH family